MLASLAGRNYDEASRQNAGALDSIHGRDANADPMILRRSFEEHVVLYCEFSRRVAGLSSESLDKLRARCAAIDGHSFGALMRRARLAARTHEVFHSRNSTPLKFIANGSRCLQTGLAVALELVGEFQMPGSRAVRRTDSTGKPRVDMFIDASFAIESALGSLSQNHPGVAAAVRAAADAVLRHDWLEPENFRRIYAFIEPEIPFAELELDSHGV